MKLLLALAAAAGLFAAGRAVLCPCSAEASPARYVEARTASVFAGACHYNGEYTTAGRAAVLAFELEGDLEGVDVVAAVAADDNLAEGSAARRSVLYLDRRLAPERAEAAERWVRTRCGEALGSIAKVERDEVAVEIEAGQYDVRVGERVALRGEALADRACCRMPLNVWYRPLVALRERVVGCSEVFRLDEPALAQRFERRGDNDAFVGR